MLARITSDLCPRGALHPPCTITWGVGGRLDGGLAVREHAALVRHHHRRRLLGPDHSPARCGRSHPDLRRSAAALALARRCPRLDSESHKNGSESHKNGSARHRRAGDTVRLLEFRPPQRRLVRAAADTCHPWRACTRRDTCPPCPDRCRFSCVCVALPFEAPPFHQNACPSSRCRATTARSARCRLGPRRAASARPTHRATPPPGRPSTAPTSSKRTAAARSLRSGRPPPVRNQRDGHAG